MRGYGKSQKAYEKASKDKNFKPYIITDTSSGSNKPKEN